MTRYKSVLKQFDLLIVNGDRDNVTPLPMQKKIAAATDAKLAIIPGVGHLAHYEKPAEMAGEIREFLKK